MTAHRIETQFAGRPLMLESGRFAKQASGSAYLQFGDTAVLAAVTVSPNQSSLPFFPLTVEYREKTYRLAEPREYMCHPHGESHDDQYGRQRRDSDRDES